MKNGPFAAAGNPGLSERTNERVFAHRWQMLRGVLARNAGAGGRRLLEAGCGNGRMTRRLLEMGFDVTAFDFSGEALRAARAYVGSDACRWIKASVAAFDSRQAFDVVLCAGILVAIPDEDEHARSTRNMARHVADGGCLIIEEVMVSLDDMVARKRLDPRKRMRFRAPEVYRDLVTGGGLDLIETVTYENAVIPQPWTIMVFRASDPAAGRPPRPESGAES